MICATSKQKVAGSEESSSGAPLLISECSPVEIMNKSRISLSAGLNPACRAGLFKAGILNLKIPSVGAKFDFRYESSKSKFIYGKLIFFLSTI